MGDYLIMSKKERGRKVILEGIRGGYFTVVEGSKRMGVSYRQGKRIWKRYREEGDKGLVHRNRGRPSGKAYPRAFREKVVKAYVDRYEGFGPTLAKEHLEEAEGLKMSVETLRQWLKAEGLWSKHRRRKGYRQRRTRRSRFGDLVQIDGSDHPWFGEDEPKSCLLDMVDDSTGKTLAELDRGETTHVILSVLKKWIEKYGIPNAVYVDLKSVYVSPSYFKKRTEETHIREGFSVFEQVCQRLDIEVIKAHSPQAKGRVERKHGVFQDRLVKMLKLKGIKNVEEANRYLEEDFLPSINHKFAKPPQDATDGHRDPRPYGDLDQLICWEYERQVKRDWTVQFNGQHYQLQKQQAVRIRPKQTVKVRKHLDGSLTMWREDKRLCYEPIDERPVRVKEVAPRPTGTPPQAKKHPPSPSPWRRFNPDWLTSRKGNTPPGQ